MLFLFKRARFARYPSSDDSVGPTQGQPFATFGRYVLQGCSPEKPGGRAIADPRTLQTFFITTIKCCSLVRKTEKFFVLPRLGLDVRRQNGRSGSRSSSAGGQSSSWSIIPSHFRLHSDRGGNLYPLTIAGTDI